MNSETKKIIEQTIKKGFAHEIKELFGSQETHHYINGYPKDDFKNELEKLDVCYWKETSNWTQTIKGNEYFIREWFIG